jgi:EAL domain-containing protein (putative c-di-GMP-specific phosphodiesterase class I)
LDTSGQARAPRDGQAELTTVIAGGIRPVFQPIFDVDDNVVVGYEALARGPGGSSLEFPGPLFAAAREGRLLAELDRACMLAACQGAEAGGLRTPTALFVNVEPEVIDADIDEQVLSFLRPLSGRLDVFIEVTERSLAARPAELLETVGRLRAEGFGIALDDLGAVDSSLALLPLLRPDIVKLDLSLIHAHPNQRSGEILNGVYAYAESTGAIILAEGVETAEHLETARSMGASLAQGWFFGRPGPLPAAPIAAHRSTATRTLPAPSRLESPIELVRQRRSAKVGSKDMLLSITRALEAQALELGEHAVVVTAFQHARFYTERTRRRYVRIASRTCLTVALGDGFDGTSTPGVHGATLAPGDPLRQEWDIAVLGPHYAGALVARDLGDSGPDHRRRFEFVLTFDRELVIDVAAALISRLTT